MPVRGIISDMSITPERMARARQLLREIRHIPLATVNEDGSPHNSPVFMVFDAELRAYWASHVETQHSRNIVRDGRVFLVVFDSREGHGGVFIEARAAPLGDTEAARALPLMQQVRKAMGGTFGEISSYTGDAPQRIYGAVPVRAWVNQSERDERGAIIRDRRVEVALHDLAADFKT